MVDIEFESLLEIIQGLPSEQKRIIRQYLDKDWAEDFGEILATIHADIPDLSVEEIQADIEAAIEEVRRGKP